ncbi:MAG: hypothetical protein OXE40_04625, partial [Gammaproteobacteria bacterium]|nr:hypothetical protein [Gammaproteobacteria bacterium]
MSISSPRAIAATIVVIVSGGGVFLILPVFVGALVDTGGLSMAQAGAVASADLAGIFAAAIAALAWIRRVDWRRVALFSLACMVAGNAACPWIDGYVPLLILRGLLGFAAGNLMAIGIAHLARVAIPDRAFALAIAAQVAFSTIALWLMPVAVHSWCLASLFGLLAGLSAIGLLAATQLVRGTEAIVPGTLGKASGSLH